MEEQAVAAAPVGVPGADGKQQEGQQQHGQAVLLPLVKLQKGIQSERLRCLVRCLRRMIPSSHLERQSKDCSRLANLLGEAPPYDATAQDPFNYLQRLLEWGAPAGAVLNTCFVPGTGVHAGKTCLDLTALHAAGCFPHTWAVPLSAAAVQEANQRTASAAAANPRAVAEGALQRDERFTAGGMLRIARGGGDTASGAAFCSAGQRSASTQPPRQPAAASAEEAEQPAVPPPAKQQKQRKAAADGPEQAAPLPTARSKLLPAAMALLAAKAGGGAIKPEPGPTMRHWSQDSEGWWRCRLSATACRSRLGLPAALFKELAGRWPAGNKESLEARAEPRGQLYALSYSREVTSRASYLHGNQFTQWLRKTGALEGDLIAFKRQGKGKQAVVLVRHIPAAEVGTVASAPSRVAVVPPSKKRQRNSIEPEAGAAAAAAAAATLASPYDSTYSFAQQEQQMGGAAAALPMGQALVGCRIQVHWADENEWYAGTVTAYKDRLHTVEYDDGNVEQRRLGKSTWQLEGPAQQPEQHPTEQGRGGRHLHIEGQEWEGNNGGQQEQDEQEWLPRKKRQHGGQQAQQPKQQHAAEPESEQVPHAEEQPPAQHDQEQQQLARPLVPKKRNVELQSVLGGGEELDPQADWGPRRRVAAVAADAGVKAALRDECSPPPTASAAKAAAVVSHTKAAALPKHSLRQRGKWPRPTAAGSGAAPAAAVVAPAVPPGPRLDVTLTAAENDRWRVVDAPASQPPPPQGCYWLDRKDIFSQQLSRNAREQREALEQKAGGVELGCCHDCQRPCYKLLCQEARCNNTYCPMCLELYRYVLNFGPQHPNHQLCRNFCRGACPCCLRICVKAACRRKSLAQLGGAPPEPSISTSQKVVFAHHLAHKLLPHVEGIMALHEQEAAVAGTSLLAVPLAEIGFYDGRRLPHSVRALCNRCGTCLENLHFHCPREEDCGEDLCPACVREERDGRDSWTVTCKCRSTMTPMRFLSDDQLQHLLKARQQLDAAMGRSSSGPGGSSGKGPPTATQLRPGLLRMMCEGAGGDTVAAGQWRLVADDLLQRLEGMAAFSAAHLPLLLLAPCAEQQPHQAQHQEQLQREQLQQQQWQQQEQPLLAVQQPQEDPQQQQQPQHWLPVAAQLVQLLDPTATLHLVPNGISGNDAMAHSWVGRGSAFLSTDPTPAEVQQQQQMQQQPPPVAPLGSMHAQVNGWHAAGVVPQLQQRNGAAVPAQPPPQNGFQPLLLEMPHCYVPQPQSEAPHLQSRAPQQQQQQDPSREPPPHVLPQRSELSPGAAEAGVAASGQTDGSGMEGCHPKRTHQMSRKLHESRESEEWLSKGGHAPAAVPEAAHVGQQTLLLPVWPVQPMPQPEALPVPTEDELHKREWWWQLEGLPASDVRLASYRGTQDFLWTPHVSEFAPTHPNYACTVRLFQMLWGRGEPIIVRGFSGQMGWTPEGMGRVCKEAASSKLTIVDCSNFAPEHYWELTSKEFFDRYKACSGDDLDASGEPLTMLKLKDFPPTSDFRSVLARHHDDFVTMLGSCMPAYCHPTHGPLNLATMLPWYTKLPDLGPKGYIAFGREQEQEGEGDSVTKMHEDLSDAINIMMHTQHREGRPPGPPRCGMTAHDPADIGYGGAGAVWDLVRREDRPKLRKFLHEALEGRVNGCPLFVHKGQVLEPGSVHDVLHDQCFMLTERHRKLLREKYNVHMWHFEQYEWEAVWIPGGCPHQVRNLRSAIKVALDFVSPEAVGECLQLRDEFRRAAITELDELAGAPEGDIGSTRHFADKLQIGNMALHGMLAALSVLEGAASGEEELLPLPPPLEVPYVEEEEEEEDSAPAAKKGGGRRRRGGGAAAAAAAGAQARPLMHGPWEPPRGWMPINSAFV